MKRPKDIFGCKARRHCRAILRAGGGLSTILNQIKPLILGRSSTSAQTDLVGLSRDLPTATSWFMPLWIVVNFVIFAAPHETLAQDQCRDIFSQTRLRTEHLNPEAFSRYAHYKLRSVPEFEFIKQAAEERGLRVWLFGGTAASYLHYVKWDVLRKRQIKNFQPDRFDFDYTNIFRSTQDLDIVIDGTPSKAKEFEQLLKQTFPHFLGSKENKWEVRPLRHSVGRSGERGYKEALLDDLNFSLQNTDSNSVAMVEITSGERPEPVVRDLRSWENPGRRSQFLTDTLNGEITYFRSKRHFETARARLGENPEILSVIRVLVKAFQYELRLSKDSEAQITQVIREFNPRKIKNEAALRRIKDTSEKLIKHAVNIEYAINKLDELGLRKKLISMGDPREPESFAWWLHKVPLRSKPVGLGNGLTAGELGIEVVAHETRSFLAYESITRAHSGEPNVVISRKDYPGETAIHGDGFYTREGREGAIGSGLTIRFRLNKDAREGKDADFTRSGDYIIIHNKAALEVIPESLNFEIKDLLLIAHGQKEFAVDHSDRALLEKLRRKINAKKLIEELGALQSSQGRNQKEKFVETLILLLSSRARELLSIPVQAETIKLIQQNLDQLFAKADVIKLFGENIKREQVSSDTRDLFGPKPKIKIFFGDIVIESMKASETLHIPQYVFGQLDFSRLSSAGSIIFHKKMSQTFSFDRLESVKWLVFPEVVYGKVSLRLENIANKVQWPKKIFGDLVLGSVERAEGIDLPAYVGGNLYMTHLKFAKDVRFPKEVLGNLRIYGLERAINVTLPDAVGGVVLVWNLGSARGVKFPKRVGGDLNLSGLRSANDVELPVYVGGDLKLNNLKSIKSVKFPKEVGGDVDLENLERMEDVILPELIGGGLNLDELRLVKRTKFPRKISGSMMLGSLESAEGLELPGFIGVGLQMYSLRSAKGIRFPKEIGDGLYFGRLKSREGLKLPASIRENVVFEQ